MSGLTDLLQDCENALGWKPSSPLWQSRKTEIGKIQRAMAKDPKRVTLPNLRLALALCRRRREPIASPAALVYRIDEALKLANTTTTTDIAQAMQDARQWEMDHRDEHSDRWGARLARASGPVRADVLKEWREAGRGPST